MCTYLSPQFKCMIVCIFTCRSIICLSRTQSKLFTREYWEMFIFEVNAHFSILVLPSNTTGIQLPKRSPLPFFNFKVIFKLYGMHVSFYKYGGFVTNQRTDEATYRKLESVQRPWNSLFHCNIAIYLTFIL